MTSSPTESPLRVLYVHHVGLLGGAERSLLGLLYSLQEKAITVFVAAPDEDGLATAIREEGLPFWPLPLCRLRRPRGVADYFRFGARFLRYCWALRRVCRAVQPDIVHANSLIAAYAAIHVTRQPIVWHCRDLRLPTRWTQIVRRRVAAVIAISQAVADYVAEITSEGAPIHIVYNGLHLREISVRRRRRQMREAWEMGLETPLIGCVGQLVPWKRQDLLIQALPAILQAIPEAHLVFIGHDAYDEHHDYVIFLRTIAKELGVAEHIVWAGYVDQPAEAIAALDLLAHPAEREPFGRVILEAMALGVPVVAVAEAGPAEIVEHERSGLLVPPNDAGALAAAITRVLQDEALWNALSDRGRIRAQDFSAARMAARVVELYREVVGR